MGKRSLDNIPDDLFLDIVGHFDTARDLASLDASSRRSHSLTRQDGWRSFVRKGFPLLDIPGDSSTSWKTVANRLTYLDRCWEKRAFLIHDLTEAQKRERRNSYTTSGRQTVSFYPVLDAHLVSSRQHELIAWGAGEDLITKLSSPYDKRDEKWYRLEGRKSGHASGFGDITALSVIDRGSSPEILVGRANGDLQVLGAAGDDFGIVSQSLEALDDLTQANETPLIRRSPGQVAINWTEWQPDANIVANCKHSNLKLYNLNDTEASELRPMAHYDLSEDGASDEISLVRSAKFLSRDTIACALGNSRRPIRWGKITPTGLEIFDAANNYESLAYLDSKSEITKDEKTTVRAIETVGRGHSESLLLSAWDDGTYRYFLIRVSLAKQWY